MSDKDDYERAKRAYHSAGRKAKGTRKNSAERKAYNAAKRKYRQAGRALKKK